VNCLSEIIARQLVYFHILKIHSGLVLLYIVSYCIISRYKRKSGKHE
uniref:Uncharacterized protein n=1 Tax=Sinocyclocheilus grahami TaxID=75366 RepID=A0A672L1W8_SINGR